MSLFTVCILQPPLPYNCLICAVKLTSHTHYRLKVENAATGGQICGPLGPCPSDRQRTSRLSANGQASQAPSQLQIKRCRISATGFSKSDWGVSFPSEQSPSTRNQEMLWMSMGPLLSEPSDRSVSVIAEPSDPVAIFLIPVREAQIEYTRGLVIQYQGQQWKAVSRADSKTK